MAGRDSDRQTFSPSESMGQPGEQDSLLQENYQPMWFFQATPSGNLGASDRTTGTHLGDWHCVSVDTQDSGIKNDRNIHLGWGFWQMLQDRVEILTGKISSVRVPSVCWGGGLQSYWCVYYFDVSTSTWAATTFMGKAWFFKPKLECIVKT